MAVLVALVFENNLLTLTKRFIHERLDSLSAIIISASDMPHSPNTLAETDCWQ